jgi:hypothetical protein
MNQRTALLAVTLCAAFSLPHADARALTVSTGRSLIGGVGSYSTTNFDNPGLLDDGLTPGAARFEYTLDDVASTFTVEVFNVSPVTVGIENPVLSAVYFNVPPQISAMSLMTQTGSGGATPAFSLTFDANLNTGPNPNGTGRFGAFAACLDNGGGVSGSISNPLADTLGVPPGSDVIGPVTFVFSLTGDLTGLTANHFAMSYSTTPPGDVPMTAAAKFQSGGVAGSSGTISARVLECFALTSRHPGQSNWIAPTSSQHSFSTRLSGVRRYWGVTRKTPLTMTRHEFDRMGRFCIEVKMWDDSVPGGMEAGSTTYEVFVRPDGRVALRPFGPVSGQILLRVEEFTTSDGRRFVRFPFQIPGM